jgi:hypothetical protein
MKMMIDPVRQKNNNEILAYSGGESGKFIWQQGADVKMGVYEGAIPHITDANFKVEEALPFPDVSTAQSVAMQMVDIFELLEDK